MCYDREWWGPASTSAAPEPRRADYPYPAVLRTSADKSQPALVSSSSSRRGPGPAAPGQQRGVEGNASNPGVP